MDRRQKTARKWTWGIMADFIYHEIPPAVAQDFDRNQKALDFGCGRGLITENLNNLYRNTRLNFVGYDLDSPVIRLHEDYLFVMASSVLNVQESEEDMADTLSDLREACSRSDGSVAPCYVSYPREPRKMGLRASDLVQMIGHSGQVASVTKCQSTKSTSTVLLQITFKHVNEGA